MKEWIDGVEAAARLGVKPQTLYAYVSRGQIEARREATGRRRSLYRAEDVARLAGRADASRKRSEIAANSMSWGEASIVTQISTVARGRLVYRGQDAARLSETATLEQTAQLLWASDDPVAFAVPERAYAHPIAALGGLVAPSQASIGRGRAALCRDACAAVAHLAAGCGVAPGPSPLHRGLASSWSLSPKQAEATRRALVLVADHELNASTFAARVAASTGAPLSACLLAGLSALMGPRHGGATGALTRMLADAAREGTEATLSAWLDRAGAVPGFGHPLYPRGDVRALALAETIAPDPLMQDLAQRVLETTGQLPNIDYALVAFARAAALPAGAAFTLFLLGRSVGWAAHAMEQALDGRLIRPRARYEGALPASED